MTNPKIQQRKRKLAIHHVIGVVAAVLLVMAIFYPDKLNAARNSLRAPLICNGVVQLGDVPVGKAAQREVPLLNAHLSTVKIKRVSASCGCTVAKTRSDSLAPWQHGLMTVSVTANRTGRGSEMVEIETDHGAQRIEVQYNAV